MPYLRSNMLTQGDSRMQNRALYLCQRFFYSNLTLSIFLFRLFESLVLSYKQDGWRSLLNNVLESALICEQQVHDTRAFFNYALQLLSSGNSLFVVRVSTMQTLTKYVKKCLAQYDGSNRFSKISFLQ